MSDEPTLDPARTDEDELPGPVPTDEAGDAGNGAPDDGDPAAFDVVRLEALLFVAERPLARSEIARIGGVDGETVDALLGDLEVLLRDRGIRLVSLDDRVQLVTAPDAGPLIGRFIGADGGRLTPAGLETLAIVAYRQPVTRGVIERIRGVDSDYVIRSLLHRRLIAEQGRAETTGRPILYATTMEFMERFGLTSLEDLPPLDAEIAGRLAVTDEGTDGEPVTAAAEVAPGG